METSQGTINLLQHLSPQKDLQIKKPLLNRPHQLPNKPSLLRPNQLSIPISETFTKDSTSPRLQQLENLQVTGYSPRRKAEITQRDSKMSCSVDPYSILPKEYVQQLEQKEKKITLSPQYSISDRHDKEIKDSPARKQIPFGSPTQHRNPKVSSQPISMISYISLKNSKRNKYHAMAEKFGLRQPIELSPLSGAVTVSRNQSKATLTQELDIADPARAGYQQNKRLKGPDSPLKINHSSMLFATQTDFIPKRNGKSSFRDRSQTRFGSLPFVNQSKSDLPSNDSMNETLFLPVYQTDQDLQKISFAIPIGPNLNNPTLPSQIQNSSLAKKFELPPMATIGIVDKQHNTIQLAPPITYQYVSPKKGKIIQGRHRSTQREQPPSFMIASPSLLNKTLHRNEAECPFVSNYHVPNRSHLQIKQAAKLIGLSSDQQRAINALNLSRPSVRTVMQDELEDFAKIFQPAAMSNNGKQRFLEFILDKKLIKEQEFQKKLKRDETETLITLESRLNANAQPDESKQDQIEPSIKAQTIRSPAFQFTRQSLLSFNADQSLNPNGTLRLFAPQNNSFHSQRSSPRASQTFHTGSKANQFELLKQAQPSEVKKMIVQTIAQQNQFRFDSNQGLKIQGVNIDRKVAPKSIQKKSEINHELSLKNPQNPLKAADNHNDLNADLMMTKVYSDHDLGTEGQSERSPCFNQVTKNMQTSSCTLIDSNSALESATQDRHIIRRESNLNEKLRIINNQSENNENNEAKNAKFQTVFLRKTTISKLNSAIESQIETLTNSSNNN